MDWSPLDAMNAYMHALHLGKVYQNQEVITNSPGLVEPKCIEFIAALAAGNRAQLMVDIASGGFSPFTLALAIAARHTGGHLICVRHEQEELEETKTHLASYDLGGVAEFRIGNPSEVIKQYGKVDFAVIDHRVEECMKLFVAIDMNPNGSVVVVSNLFHGSVGASYAQVVKGREGIESVILPIGEGMEVTRIGRGCNHKGRSCKRSLYHV